MDRSAINTPRSRLEEEVMHDEEVQGAAPKRRRLSASLASEAGGSQVSTNSCMEDTQSDGCRTPPRTSEPRSILNSPAQTFLGEQPQLLHASATLPSEQNPAAVHEHISDRLEFTSSSVAQATSSSNATSNATISLEALPAQASNSSASGQPILSSTAVDTRVESQSSTTTSSQSVAQSLQLPRFVKSVVPFQPWSLEYHVAFIKFAAQDAVLLAFMTTNASSGMAPRLRSFSDLTGGPSENSLYKMLLRYRAVYDGFKKAGLSAAARASRASTWSLEQDRRLLAEREARKSTKWLSIVHDEIYVRFPDCDPLAAVVPRVRTDNSSSGSRHTGTQNATTGTTPILAMINNTSPLSIASTRSAASSSHSQSYSTGVGTSSTVTSTPSSLSFGVPINSQVTRRDAEYMELRGQVNHQRIEIATLQAQCRRQGELLIEQARLIQREAVQMQQQAQSAEQKFKVQNETIEVMKQQIEALQQQRKQG